MQCNPPKGQARWQRLSASWALDACAHRGGATACRLRAWQTQACGWQNHHGPYHGGRPCHAGQNHAGRCHKNRACGQAFVVTARSKATIFPEVQSPHRHGEAGHHGPAKPPLKPPRNVTAPVIAAATCWTTKTAITRRVVTTFKTARAATATKIATRRLGSALCRLQTWNHFRLELLTAVAPMSKILRRSRNSANVTAKLSRPARPVRPMRGCNPQPFMGRPKVNTW